jgi:acetyl-CoA carboxylase biotin carboxyl carrier protein
VELSSDDVQDILRMLDDLPFGEMRLQTSRFTLVLRRAGSAEWTQEMQVRVEPAVLPPVPAGEGGADEAAPHGPAAAETGGAQAGAGEEGRPAAVSVGAGGAEAAGVGPGGEDGLVPVRAPLPGTFYRAPQPGAAPFVEVGNPVEADTVVGIVETMKLMNSVSAQVSGTVAQIVVGNAEPAQRDAVLMWIREDQ